MIIYDIETKTSGNKPDPDVDEFRSIHIYNVEEDKNYFYTYKDDINLIQDHFSTNKVIVGYNNQGYDDVILKRFGVYMKYNINIDMYQVVKKRGIYLGIKNISLSLDSISKFFKLDIIKLPFDYNILQKDEWSAIELEKIKIYNKRDVELTYQIYKKFEEFFKPFKEYLSKDDVNNYSWLKSSIAVYTYKVFCNLCGLDEVYDSDAKVVSYEGGYVSKPEVDEEHGDILCLDFACLCKDTKIITNKGIKTIQNINKGDIIKVINGYDEVINIRKRKVLNIKRVEHETGFICCTSDHRLLKINLDGTTMPIPTKLLKNGDKLICLKKDMSHGIKEKNVNQYQNLQKPELEKKIQIGEEEKNLENAQFVEKNLDNLNQSERYIAQKNMQISEEVLIHGLKNYHQKNELNGVRLVKKQKKNLEKKKTIMTEEESKIDQYIENGESVCLKEINTPARFVEKKEDIYKLTILKNGINLKKNDLMLKMEKLCVYDATENFIKRTEIIKDGQEIDKFISVNIKRIDDLYYNDYVYDITLKNSKKPYFIANNIISHNSLYPHIYICNNLTNHAKRREPYWKGDNFFDVKGKYSIRGMGIINKTLKRLYDKRKEYKKKRDQRQYALKIVINTFYGITGNPVFKSVYDFNSARDCTAIGRKCIQYAREVFEKAGYKFLYTDTDSVYIKDPYNDIKQLLSVKDILMTELKKHMPFPVDSFDMDIDYKIKHIWFFNGKKKNYMFVTENDELVIKGLPMTKSDGSGIGYYIFSKYMKKQVLNGDIKFSFSEIYNYVLQELDSNIELVAREFKVYSEDSYKAKGQIQAQISRRYGEGRHKLIPNNLYGVGKSIKYCTIKEFKTKGLTVDNIILNKMWSELKPFLNYIPKNKKSIGVSNKQLLLAQWGSC